MNIFFDRVGVGNFKYLPLTKMLLKKYNSKFSIGTTEWDNIIEEFQGEFTELIDLRKINCDDSYRNELSQQFEPVDAVLLEKMAIYEHDILQVISRTTAFRDFLSRTNFYYQCLSYWNGILKKYEIDMYLSESISHEVHGIIIYYLCKAKGIRTLVLADMPIPGYSFVTEDIHNLLPEFENAFYNMKKENLNKIELNEDFSNTFNTYTDYNVDITPDYVKKENKEIQKAFKNFEVSFLRRLVFALISSFQIIFNTRNRNLIRFISKQFATRDYLNTRGEAFRYYNENVSDYNYNEKYIYVPLHVQPEQTTLPMAEKYENQLLYIKMLSYCLPEGYFLYVKEHPGQLEINWAYPDFRNIKYYQELKGIKKVKLISTEVDTYELLNHSVAVATATGTIGFEAAFRDKQVIMFGNRVYQYAPGVYKVRTIEECKRIVSEVIVNSDKYLTDKNKMKIWLATLQKFSFYKCTHKNYKVCRNNDTDKVNYVLETLVEKIGEENA